VRIVPVSERFADYGRSVVQQLREQGIRAELDDASAGMSKKIRRAALFKIPNVLVVGEREQSNGSVTWRRHGLETQQTIPVGQLVREISRAIASRQIGWALLE
jgi:threonyl-tRNA synthetase